MMKIFIILFTLIVYSFKPSLKKRFFSVKTATNLYMKPDISSPVIYPIDHAKELIKKKKTRKLD